MTNEQVSAKTLWQATAGAVVVGLIVLVTLIMPAEYNEDPTGIGAMLGLTALSPEALEAAKNAQNEQSGSAGESDSLGDFAQLVIPPMSGLEYKMSMTQGAQVTFEWMTDGAEVYVDMHGEPKGDTTGYFKSYTIARASKMEGSFIAPFEGSHGWYFKNETGEPISIQLFFNGEYQNPHLL